MMSLHVAPFIPLMALISPAFIAGVPNRMIQLYISRVQKKPHFIIMEYSVQANGDFPT
uniref:Uncharacterized protein n=1 Tax=Picea sitchensis TaxID=3332 RepID=A9NSR0_PICSI|nr:unknown [Picea sitchensis]